MLRRMRCVTNQVNVGVAGDLAGRCAPSGHDPNKSRRVGVAGGQGHAGRMELSQSREPVM